jgi:cytochrome c oxidase subunit 5a
MTDLQGHDLIPEPKVVSAALRACRRINDLALAVRFLEAVHIKCGTKKHVDQVYPWILQEVSATACACACAHGADAQIRPVLDELGISTPEELGYDKPELFIPDAAWWWERSWYKDYGYDKLKGYKY